MRTIAFLTLVFTGCGVPAGAAVPVKDYDYSGWQGLLAPRGTPKPVLDKLYGALTRTAKLNEIREALAAQATQVTTSTPAEFRQLAQQELDKYGKVIKAIGLKVE
jgi:tripartite-type tricarboxylate transporter receptor subunit TctC